MSSSSTQFATAREMGIYEPFRQVAMWKDTFGSDNDSYMGASTIGEVDARLENKVKDRYSLVSCFFDAHKSLF